MSVGSKIKNLRKKRGMTQAILSDGIITRGMLSRIESGSAMPSMQSLNAIACRLEVSPSFLLEDGDDISPAEQARIAKAIEKEYRSHNYTDCLNLFNYLQLEADAKFSPIFVCSAFECAKVCFYNGDFKKAKELLTKVEIILPSLLIPPANVSKKEITLLLNIIENINDLDSGIELVDDKPDFHSSLSVFFAMLKLIKHGNHAECVALMKYCDIENLYEEYINASITVTNYKFIDAILSMKAILANESCPVFLKLLCLSSIENCCKLCEDYKGAYENHLAYQATLNSINK